MIHIFANSILQEASEKKIDFLVTKYSVERSFIEDLTEIDPTQSSKYLEWILKQVLANQKNPEEGFNPDDSGEDVREVLENYDTVKNRGNFTGKKDINQYKHFGDIAKDVDEALNKVTNKTKSDIPGATLLKKDETYKLILVDSYDAAKVLFSGSSWCVRHSHAFSVYGPPFLLITKNDTPYLLAHARTKSLMDKYDKPYKHERIKIFEDYILTNILAPILEVYNRNLFKGSEWIELNEALKHSIPLQYVVIYSNKKCPPGFLNNITNPTDIIGVLSMMHLHGNVNNTPENIKIVTKNLFSNPIEPFLVPAFLTVLSNDRIYRSLTPDQLNVYSDELEKFLDGNASKKQKVKVCTEIIKNKALSLGSKSSALIMKYVGNNFDPDDVLEFASATGMILSPEKVKSYIGKANDNRLIGYAINVIKSSTKKLKPSEYDENQINYFKDIPVIWDGVLKNPSIAIKFGQYGLKKYSAEIENAIKGNRKLKKIYNIMNSGLHQKSTPSLPVRNIADIPVDQAPRRLPPRLITPGNQRPATSSKAPMITRIGPALPANETPAKRSIPELIRTPIRRNNQE